MRPSSSVLWVFCLAIMALGFAGIAQAATLVSNLDEPSSGALMAAHGQWMAAPFVTDANSYQMASVTVKLTPLQWPAESAYSSFTRIHADDGTGRPGALLAEMINPPIVGGQQIPGDYTFEAPAPIPLNPNTRYWIVLGPQVEPTQFADWPYTTSTGSVGPGSIPGQVYWSLDDGASWQLGWWDRRMLFRVDFQVPGHTLTGHVTLAGDPVAGITFAASAGASCGNTDADGEYACTVPEGWSGLVTPLALSTRFGPASRAYVSVITDQFEQDYEATPDTETVWLDDTLPEGARLFGTWTWVQNQPTPYSGTHALKDQLASGLHGHLFTPGPADLTFDASDTLFAYVHLDPTSPPTQLSLFWMCAGNMVRIVHWGDPTQYVDRYLLNTFLMPHGFAAYAASYSARSSSWMGPMPSLGEWVRLEVPASMIHETCDTAAGMGFLMFNGTATWDKVGKSLLPPTQKGQIQFTSATYANVESATEIGIKLNRLNGSAGQVTVNLIAEGGSATPNYDYYIPNPLVTFPDGAWEASATFRIWDDAALESDETVNLRLSNPGGGAVLGGRSTAVLTIQDDDAPSFPNTIQFYPNSVQPTTNMNDPCVWWWGHWMGCFGNSELVYKVTYLFTVKTSWAIKSPPLDMAFRGEVDLKCVRVNDDYSMCIRIQTFQNRNHNGTSNWVLPYEDVLGVGNFMKYLKCPPVGTAWVLAEVTESDLNEDATEALTRLSIAASIAGFVPALSVPMGLIGLASGLASLNGQDDMGWALAGIPEEQTFPPPELIVSGKKGGAKLGFWVIVKPGGGGPGDCIQPGPYPLTAAASGETLAAATTPSASESAYAIFSDLQEAAALARMADVEEGNPAHLTESEIEEVRSSIAAQALGLGEKLAAQVLDGTGEEGTTAAAIGMFLDAQELASAGDVAGALSAFEAAFVEAGTAREQGIPAEARLPFQVTLSPAKSSTNPNKNVRFTATAVGAVGEVSLTVSGQPPGVETVIEQPLPNDPAFNVSLDLGTVQPGTYLLQVTAHADSGQAASDFTLIVNATSVHDLCPCENSWNNHGSYVSCIARACEEFIAAGKMTGEEKGATVSEAAQSTCGKKRTETVGRTR